ncbi:MAG: aminotransferase class IV [Candidatus Vogelbacteria bacterium]|nr:aminotransferase class IV [Candidatus Vogelbacteria bacterium]
MKKYFSLNGKVQEINKPAVQVNDIGLLRGYGVFDFLRTYNGKIFHWDEHFKRFTASAKALNLKVPVSQKLIEKEIYALAKKNGCSKTDYSIRLVLTGGPTDDGMIYKKPTFAILLEDIYDFPKKLYRDGAKMMNFDYQRLLPESKNNNYIWAIRLIGAREKKGAIEILFTADNKILEGATSNFFIFKGATLITAKKAILKGITRKLILKLARGKFKVEEREVKVSELESASEAFITGTNKLIMPVVQVDGKKIGHGKVGENTKYLMDKFKEYTERY